MELFKYKQNTIILNFEELSLFFIQYEISLVFVLMETGVVSLYILRALEPSSLSGSVILLIEKMYWYSSLICKWIINSYRLLSDSREPSYYSQHGLRSYP